MKQIVRHLPSRRQEEVNRLRLRRLSFARIAARLGIRKQTAYVHYRRYLKWFDERYGNS